MKEFGYEVSKDYEKLWLILQSAIEHIHIHCNIDGYAGFRDLMTLYSNPENDVGERVGYIWGDEAFIAKTDKDEFILWCKEIDLTFIYLEIPKGNELFYTDGTQVNVGDDCKIKFDNKTFLDEKIATYRGCYSFNKQDAMFRPNPQPIINCHYIIWDGNRMVNVAKVEK